MGVLYLMLLYVYNLSKIYTSLQFDSTLVTSECGVLIKTSHGPSFEEANRWVISNPFMKMDGFTLQLVLDAFLLISRHN